MYKENFTGQTFGNRKILRNYCVDEDWIKIGKKVPSDENKRKYKLGKCLNCGMVFPVLIKNVIHQPPKRCVFCSNIGNHHNITTNTNSWAVYDNQYAVINVLYHNKVISAQIDYDDYERTKQYIWRISKKKNKFYLLTGSKFKSTVTYLHKFILNQEIPEGYEIDHKDGNSLNNRKSNLRIVTRLENIQNTRERIDNQIGIRGISPDRNKTYKVDFAFNKQRYYFKNWNSLEEAVYCRKFAEEFFGLEMLKNNPKAMPYLTLSKSKQEEIYTYVIEQISRK